MTEYDNNLRGALFKNDKEGGNEKWPDYKGACEIAGVEYWIAGWIKTSKKGSKFMSLTFKPKDDERKPEPKREAAPEPKQEPKAKVGAFDDMADDLPW